MLAAGTSLGPYRILAPLGAGGMGEVYRAHDSRLDRDVAIELIPAALARDPERIERFEREVRAAGALNHPNVCTIHDVGAHEGAPFVVMELLEGQTLRERLAAGPIPVQSVDVRTTLVFEAGTPRELDQGFRGKPKEPYGFSKDARRRFGPPSFEDAAVEVTADSVTIHFRIR